MGAPLSIPRRRLTIANFHAMIAAGVLTEDERIELIDGELLQMAPIGALHARTVTALQEIFSKQAAGEVVWVQNPISLPPDNEPQPDLAILRPGFRGETGLPAAADVLLAVEIAHASLARDRDVKIPLYARHGVVEAWLFDLDSLEVFVYLDPAPQGYRKVLVPAPRGSLIPLRLPHIEVELALVWPSGEG